MVFGLAARQLEELRKLSVREAGATSLLLARSPVDKIHEDFLSDLGYSETFEKKHARILWNIDMTDKPTRGEITDLSVCNFEILTENQYLYRFYSFDIGNCLSDWDGWEFTDVLIKIFVGNIVPTGLRKKVLLEFSRVIEWRPLVAFWIYRNYSPDA